MTLPTKTTTARRILDQLHQKDMAFEEIARVLNDTSKPALRKVVKNEIRAGHIVDAVPYTLTQEARRAYIEEPAQQYVATFKPLSPSNIPSRYGMREGSNDMLQYSSKH